MKCIKIIKDEDFDIVSKSFNNPRVRIGARGIVLNSEGKIAILYKSLKNEYKLIGGGVESSENSRKAFQREALEECGCEVEIIKFLGTIEEHKTLDNFKQISFVYVAKVTKDNKRLSLTIQETKEGAELMWLPLNDAIQRITECEKNLLPSSYDSDLSIYHTKFIVRRDATILNYYKNLISK